MRSKKNNYYNKKNKGFTIIESIVYIALTSLILLEGVSICTSMYKSYIDSKNESIEYNNIRNFYINMDNILSQGNIENIEIKNIKIENNVSETNRLCISKHVADNSKYDYQTINSYNGNIVVKYKSKNPNKEVKDTINVMLEDIDHLEITQKENLIYLDVFDKNKKEFIRCI